MDNQVTTTQNAYMSTLKDQVVMANHVVSQAAEWTAEAQQMQAMAQKEKETIKSIKKYGRIIKISIPLVALLAVSRLYALFNFSNDVVGLILTGVICIIVWCIPLSAKKHIKKVDECEKKVQEYYNSANMLVQKYADCLSIIPQQYWYPLATSYIAEVISNGRASTIPVALDKLEEQLYRWNMEQNMQRQIELQRAQTEALRRIEINTTASVVADIAGLFFN